MNLEQIQENQPQLKNEARQNLELLDASALNAENFVENLEPSLKKDLHAQETLDQNQENLSKKTGTVFDFFDTNRLLNDVRYRNLFLSGTNAFLHGLATITNFVSQTNPALKVLNSVIDKAAFFCTRWVSPFISYGHAAYQAMSKQKEPVLALIKLIPPVFFPFVGDSNIDMVYGTSTALNQPYDMTMNRIKDKINSSPEYAQQLHDNKDKPLYNLRILFDGLKDILKDPNFLKKNFWKEGIFVLNCSMMLLGSIPMLLFGRDQRDTLFAKVSGVLRNVGGWIGDYGWAFGGKVEKEKTTMAVLYAIAQGADIVKRFVGEESAKVLIHLSAALNVSAMTMWNTLNTDNKKESLEDVIAKKLKEKSSVSPEVITPQPHSGTGFQGGNVSQEAGQKLLVA